MRGGECELERNAIDYLDGKLSPAERSTVEQHLAACVSCHERVAGFSSVMGLLDEWPGVQPSPFFQTRLAARLKEETASESWWKTLWQGRRAATRPLFAAAIAIVLVIGAVLIEYSPAPIDSDEGVETSAVTIAVASPEELPLYQDLPLLEDYEVLRNFEVLQVLENPVVQ